MDPTRTPAKAVSSTAPPGGFQAFGTSTLSGIVFADTNGDGVKQFREQGIAGVPVELKGKDYLGNPVDLRTTTASDGSYTFLNNRLYQK